MQQALNEQEQRVFMDLPPLKAVLTLALPTVISQVITVIYNLADTYFVGRTNEPSMVAAVQLCMPLMLVITGIANLFGIGGASLIARSLGTGDFQRARRASAFAVWGGAAAIALYGLLLLLAHGPLLRLLGAKEDTLAYCYAYMRYVCIIGGLPTLLNPLLAHMMRSEGAAREASVGVSLGGFLNMALDPLFMFVIMPEGQEVAGAAVATMLSNLAASLYFIIRIRRNRRDSVLSLSPRDLSLREGIPGEILSTGLPSFLMTLLSSLSNIAVNNLIAGASSAAIAGMGIAKKMNMLSFRVSTGVTQGALPLIAYTHSAAQYGRMRRSILSAAAIAVSFAALCMCLSFTLGSHLVRFFINDPLTVDYGAHFIRLICLAMPLASASMTVMMLFQASARRFAATLLSVLRKGVLDIPIMFLLGRLWPLYGVACATPIAELFSCAVALAMMFQFFKKLRMQGRKGELLHA